jgi:tetratricopeptide (TPR) repeat protein
MMKRRLLVSVFLCGVAFATRSAVADEPHPARFLGVVQCYLTVLERMGQFSADPRAALLLAQNSMKEIYEQKGQKAEAVSELRKILDGLDDPAVRTAVRFAIADIYKETGQKDRALEELRLVVAENKALLTKKR